MAALSLTCWACGATAESTTRTRCDCGETLWVETDPHGFGWNSRPDASGLWRYGDLLPIESPAGVGAAAGGTPLVRTPALDAEVGAHVHLKVEGVHPTGSFKDRGSAVAAAFVREAGVDAIGTVSHGNMATSTAAHAASLGLDCVVCVPADIPETRLGHIAQFDPTILRVDGDYGELYERSLALGPEAGVRFVNSDTPLRVAGQKTTTLELLAAFAPDVPDAVVLPVSSGGHASGAWKALLEARAAGLLPSTPRLYLVQAAACAPIAEAFGRGDGAVTPVEGGDTVAYSIANADPPSGTRALTAARETGGAVLAVDDGEIMDAKRTLAIRAGLSVEASSATVLAGARRLAARGAFDADEDVVLVTTGDGFKAGANANVDSETVAIDDLSEHLQAVGR